MATVIDPDTSELDYILSECLVATAQSCSAPIEPDAIKWWLGHYRHLFYRAMTEKGRQWEGQERRNVLAKSKDLGRTAARLAAKGKVTARIAEKASGMTDCVPAPGATTGARREIWCSGGS